MELRKLNQQECYGAFCKSPRSVYSKQHVTTTNVLLSFLVSFLLMFIFWQRLDPKVLFLFVCSMSVAEVFIQMRWRLSMSCIHCGFDPITYMKSPEKAAAKVKLTYEQKSNEVDFYFTESPLLRKLKGRAKSNSPMLSPVASSVDLPLESEIDGHFQLVENQEDIDPQIGQP